MVHLSWGTDSTCSPSSPGARLVFLWALFGSFGRRCFGRLWNPESEFVGKVRFGFALPQHYRLNASSCLYSKTSRKIHHVNPRGKKPLLLSTWELTALASFLVLFGSSFGFPLPLKALKGCPPSSDPMFRLCCSSLKHHPTL